jgi:hypothetical protein
VSRGATEIDPEPEAQVDGAAQGGVHLNALIHAETKKIDYFL